MSRLAIQQHATTPPALLRLGEDWVVHDAGNDRLLVLNDTARRIWTRWQGGDDVETIAAALAVHYAVPVTQVRADVADCIARWQVPSAPQRHDSDADLYPTQSRLPQQPDRPADRRYRDFRIHGHGIRVHLDDDVDAGALLPVLGHLARPGPAAAGGEYDLERCGTQVRLRQGRRVIHQGPSMDGAMVHLLHEVQLAAYRERDNLCVLHAAAVGRAGACVLLPGVAGAGKSTLTAALLHQGWDYLSDDTVPVDAASGRALALTPPLTIKAGSIAALVDRYPHLDALPVHQRADQPVRYLPPPAASLATTAAHTVAAVVFPRYRPGASARLSPIPVAEAFAHLAAAGIFARHPREPARLKALLDWFGGLRSFALEYDRLDDACRLVAEAFDTGTRPGPHQPHRPADAPGRTGT